MANTYLNNQSQKFLIKLKSLGYTPRAKDILLTHGFGLRLYGVVSLSDYGGNTALSNKIQFCYPVIGTTKVSQGLDFVRLTSITGTNWVTGPGGSIIHNNDGSFDLNNPLTSGLPRAQYVVTDFTPLPNQTNYHLSYYSTQNTALRASVEIGNGNGAAQTLLFGIKQNATVPNGMVGACYSPSIATLGTGSSLGFFTMNGSVSTMDYYADGLLITTSSLSHIPTSPGPIWFGKTSSNTYTYTDRGCEGACGGLALTSNEVELEQQLFQFLHNNK